MSTQLKKKFTLNDLRQARTDGRKIAMLTCYDFTTARLMQEAGYDAEMIEREGFTLLGWRDVPKDNSSLGESAKPTEPALFANCVHELNRRFAPPQRDRSLNARTGTA